MNSDDLEFPLPISFTVLTIARLLFFSPFFLWKMIKNLYLKLWNPSSSLPNSPPNCLGHRGAKSHEILENSFQAFQYAYDVGAWGIELDIQSTVDGEIVVLHDLTLDRTCLGTGVISELAWKEIQNISLKNGERLPRLTEVIQQWGDKFHINIEIKKEPTSHKTMESVRLLCKILDSMNPPLENITISSFSPLALYYVRNISPRWRRFQLIADPLLSRIPGWRGLLLGTWAFAIAWNAKGMVWEKSILFRSPWLHIIAQLLEKKVWIYTSNLLDEWNLAEHIGIEGVITDIPKEYLAAINSKNPLEGLDYSPMIIEENL